MKLEKGEYKREFKRFLYKEKIVWQFLKNILSPDNDWKEEYNFNNLKEYLNNVYPYDYVSSAFDWDKVDEKFNFWSNISDKWYHYLDNIRYAKSKVHRTTPN